MPHGRQICASGSHGGQVHDRGYLPAPLGPCLIHPPAACRGMAGSSIKERSRSRSRAFLGGEDASTLLSHDTHFSALVHTITICPLLFATRTLLHSVLPAA